MTEPRCDHDWHIWPETDGQEQRCAICKEYRQTPLSPTLSIKDRAKLRASQERRLEHARLTIEGLITLHMPDTLGEREIAELQMMCSRLLILIKHQHVKDRQYAETKMSAQLIEGEW